MPFAFISRPTALMSSYQGFSYDLSNLSTYSYSGVNFGVPAPNRYVLVGFAARSASTFTATSVTVAGQSATILGQYLNGGTVSGMAIALVPAGTSGSVSITYSGAMVHSGVGVWTLTNLQSASAVATFNFNSTTTINIPEGGGAFGVTANNSNVRNFSAGLTARYASGLLTDSTEPDRVYAAGDLTTGPSLSSLGVSISGTFNAGSSFVVVLR